MDNPVITSWIAEMVDDPEHRVQSAVLAALGRGMDGNIRPRIESMLASGRIWLQASAVYVLQETMPGWAYEVLERYYLRGVEDRRLRERVRNLLAVLARRTPGSTPVAFEEPELPDARDVPTQGGGDREVDDDKTRW
jgi:hypothetical protein